MSASGPRGRILVTGATGFVGRTLVAALLEAGFDVLGVSHSPPPPVDRSGAQWRRFDLTAAPWSDTDFDGVIHLAGLAQVGPSFDAPQRYIETNSAMMTNLCEPLLRAQSTARVVVVSSAAVYGSGGGRPITEESRLDLTSPYAVSKALVENQSSYYRARGLDTVIARPFNHIGPGQGPGFIVPDLARKLRQAGEGARVQAGNLDAARDYTDVRDVARAYIELLQARALTHDTYNIASGESHTGWEILNMLAAAMRTTVPEIEINQTRALDPSAVLGDATRLRANTTWQPTYTLAESIGDFVRESSAR